jgi:hypothetical protein
MVFDAGVLGCRTLAALTVADPGLVGMARAGPPGRPGASPAPRNMMLIIFDVPVTRKGRFLIDWKWINLEGPSSGSGSV